MTTKRADQPPCFPEDQSPQGLDGQSPRFQAAAEQEGALAPDAPARLRIAGQICEGQVLEERAARRDVRVTIIRGGASINGYYYSH